mgnify:CR=1 FL=1
MTKSAKAFAYVLLKHSVRPFFMFFWKLNLDFILKEVSILY